MKLDYSDPDWYIAIDDQPNIADVLLPIYRQTHKIKLKIILTKKKI